MTRGATKSKLRLAMRHEGNYWNAYAALPDTMAEALLLGSIAMRFVVDNKARKEAFTAIMQEAMGEVLEEMGVNVEHWQVGPAPEHERSGHS